MQIAEPARNEGRPRQLDGAFQTLRDDALAAIQNMREIIDQQFTAFGDRPWFIKGTIGQIFIKREWESNPFIRTYYLPTCPVVGPYCAISFAQGLAFHDYADYGNGEWTDEEFATAFNARSPQQVIKVGVPPGAQDYSTDLTIILVYA